MGERPPRREHDQGSVHDGAHCVPHLCVVSVPIEVDAPEWEPARCNTEKHARRPILLSACASGTALGEKAGAPIPTSRRSVGGGIQGKDGEKLDVPPGACPARHRRAEREDAVIRMRREDDNRAHGTIIAALAAAEQDVPASGWRRVVPASLRRRLRPLRAAVVERRRRRPAKLGDLRRTTPIDANWGFERGTPIDRVYVERFIGAHAHDIRGRVLEIAAPDYTSRFGRGVTSVDILMAEDGNPEATIVGDLVDAPQIPNAAFDCAIVTQTLQFIYDVRGALATLERVLAPGGVLLATAPGLTKISPREDAAYGEWWHYTARSMRRLGAEAFGEGNVEVESYGNVLAATGFLYGLAASDLTVGELAARDPLYEVVVGLRAVKPA